MEVISENNNTDSDTNCENMEQIFQNISNKSSTITNIDTNTDYYGASNWRQLSLAKSVCLSYHPFDTFDVDDSMVVAAFDQHLVECDATGREYKLVQVKRFCD